MIKNILGIAPKLEDDGSYSPSKVALSLAVSTKTDFVKVSYEKYQGPKSKILIWMVVTSPTLLLLLMVWAGPLI